ARRPGTGPEPENGTGPRALSGTGPFGVSPWLGREPLVGRRRRPDRALEREEDLDHDRVELRADRLAETASRLLHGQPLSVGPVRRHRVERVADKDDP